MYVFPCQSRGEAKLLLKTLQRKGITWRGGRSISTNFILTKGYTIRRGEFGWGITHWNSSETMRRIMDEEGFREIGWSEILKL